MPQIHYLCTSKIEHIPMITVKDKQFELMISEAQIKERVAAVAARLNQDYAGRNPLLVCVLNGAFVFAADLVRCLDFEHEIQFVRMSSYSGMDTTGKVREVMGLTADITDRDVIIVEDIVDTGVTLHHALPKFKAMGARSVEICCLLMKPEKLRVPLDVKYCALEIPAAFIVGYGLDYDEKGRNLRDIYVVKE